MKTNIWMREGFAKKIVLGVLLAASLLNQAQADSSDLRVVTNVSAGVQTIEYKLFADASDKTSYNITNASVQYVGIGMTAIMSRVTMGINIEASGLALGTSSAYLSGVYSSSNSSNNLVARGDYSITSGYSITDNIAAFLGYASGETVIGTGVVRDAGPFVGMRYSMPAGKDANLSFNVGYAAMQGSVIWPGASGFTANGNSTTGFNYSVTWLKSLDRGRSMYLRMKIKDYTTTGDSPGYKIAADQKFMLFSFGLGF